MTNCYAYMLQVRETEESPWEDHTLVVSPPGTAPRDVFSQMKPEYVNLGRVRRIKTIEEFGQVVEAERPVSLAVKEGFENCPLEFNDGILTSSDEL